MATGRIPSVQNASTLAGTTLATNVTASSLTSLGTSPALTTPTISTTTTNGDLLYGTGSGAIARLGIGSSAQVLTVASGIPSWATASSGGMTLLSTTTLSGASTTISGISGAYENLQIEIVGVTNSTANGLLKISPNADATISNGVGVRMVITISINFWDMQAFIGATTGNFTRTDSNNATLLNIYNYADTSNYKNFNYTSDFLETLGTNRSVNACSGAISTNSAITSLKLEQTGGNFAGGTVRIYGVK